MNIVIITYTDRSGSTFLANQLSKFPEVLVFPEAGALSGYLLKNPTEKFKITKTLKKILQSKSERDYPSYHALINEIVEKRQNSPADNIYVFIDLLKKYAEKHDSNASIWVFKQANMVNLFEYYDRFNKYGYDLKLVSIIRDPRAVFNSQIRAAKNFPDLKFYSNPLISANNWQYFYYKMGDVHYSSRHFKVYYEKLIHEFKDQLKAILDFTGINASNDINGSDGRVFEKLSETEKKLHGKINDMPDISRTDAWKNELKPLLIKIIERYTIKKHRIPEYKPVNPSCNIIYFYFMILLYKLRIAFSIDKY